MKGILSKSDGTKKGGGQLKALGTQMGYAIGVLIWVDVELNDQTVFRSILENRSHFISFTNLPFTLLSRFIRRLLFNLIISDLFLL